MTIKTTGMQDAPEIRVLDANEIDHVGGGLWFIAAALGLLAFTLTALRPTPFDGENVTGGIPGYLH